jgi:hypothetical protein
MGAQYWITPVPPFHIAGNSLNTFTTLADVFPLAAHGQFVIPANTLLLGSEVEIEAAGSISSTGTPTFTPGFYYGGVAGAALAAASAKTAASGAASHPWKMRYRGVVRAIGTSGSIVGSGELYWPTSLSAWTPSPIPEVAASRTVTIDTTTAKVITVGAACSASSASNIFAVDDISVKLVNA